jgi:hypothetical protein
MVFRIAQQDIATDDYNGTDTRKINRRKDAQLPLLCSQIQFCLVPIACSQSWSHKHGLEQVAYTTILCLRLGQVNI